MAKKKYDFGKELNDSRKSFLKQSYGNARDSNEALGLKRNGFPSKRGST